MQNVKLAYIVMDTHILTREWWGRGEPIMICSANSNGKILNISIEDVSADAENKAVAVGTIEGLKLRDCEIFITDRGGREYAERYDISPNGQLEIMNDFVGTWYCNY